MDAVVVGRFADMKRVAMKLGALAGLGQDGLPELRVAPDQPMEVARVQLEKAAGAQRRHRHLARPALEQRQLAEEAAGA